MVRNNEKKPTCILALLTTYISYCLVIFFVSLGLTNSYAQEDNTVTSDELIDFFSPSEEKIKDELGQSGTGKTRGMVDIPKGHSDSQMQKSTYKYEPKYTPQQTPQDKQQQIPQQAVQQIPQTGKVRTKPEARMRFQNILFDVNAYTIKESSYTQLDEIGKALKIVMSKHHNSSFVIEGHTDSSGSAKHNEKLSTRRAQMVRDFLVIKYDLDNKQIIAVGYGENRPVASNDNQDGRSMNRRVEIVRR